MNQCRNCRHYQPINGTAPWHTPGGYCLQRPLDASSGFPMYFTAEDIATMGTQYAHTTPDDGCVLWEGGMMPYGPLTDDELTAIKARAEAATPGPWRDLPPTERDIISGYPRWYIARKVGVDDVPPEKFYIAMTAPVGINADRDKADAEFIAHARTDIPCLLAAIAALKERIEEAEGRLYDAWETGLGEDA